MKYVAEGKERLDRFLSRKLPDHSRSKIVKCIEDGSVLVEGEVATKSGFQLKPGWEVEIGEIPETAPHDMTPVPMDLEIVYEDEALLVVNKPRGLAVHPADSHTGPTLVHGLLARAHGLSEMGGSFRPGIVHRLDKETTGLMIVAKSDASHRELSEQIQARTVQRRYVALARGFPAHQRFTIDAPIGRHQGIPTRMTVKNTGKAAVTHVRVIGVAPADKGSLLACRLETGRTHQIRVHLSHFGFPVLGDAIYAPDDWKSGPMHLHAAALKFVHPFSGEEIAVYAAPPEDFLGREVITESLVVGWE